MSPSSRQFTTVLPFGWTGEPNSDPFWIDGVTCSTFHEETLRLFEGVTMPLEGPAPLSANHPLPSLDDDNQNPPPAFFGGASDVDNVSFTFAPSTMSSGVQSDELFYRTYQAICDEFFQDKDGTYLPAHAMGIYEVPPLASHDDSVDSITQALSHTHLPFEPVNSPTTTVAYASSFDYSCDSQTPSTPGRASIASPPTSSSPSHYDSSKPDGEEDTDYSPPSDEDEEYRPTQATSSEKKKRKARAKATRTTTSSARSPTSESEKSIASSCGHQRSHPYKQSNRSRNFQRQDHARFINKMSEFHCPVAGCDHTQENRRIPDLKRHIATHDRWIEPEKWTCRGVGVEKAHLYVEGVEMGMSKEEQIKAGAYEFKGKLMVGGCLNTFARRDSLKRHVDNPKTSCVGDMDSYFY